MNDNTIPYRLESYRKHLSPEAVEGVTNDDIAQAALRGDSYTVGRKTVGLAELALLERLDAAHLLKRPDDYMAKYPSIRNVHPKMTVPGHGDRYDRNRYDNDTIAALLNADWELTEKIDGTNIRVNWNGVDAVNVAGRQHKRGNIPDNHGVAQAIESVFTVERFADLYAGKPMTIYVEAYGDKISSHGHVYGPGAKLAVLDVVIAGWWLQRDKIIDVAGSFGLQAAPLVDTGRIDNGVELVEEGLESQLGSGFYAEGLVGRPVLDFLTRDGKPIRVKIKHKYLRGDSKSMKIT